MVYSLLVKTTGDGGDGREDQQREKKGINFFSLKSLLADKLGRHKLPSQLLK